MRLRKAKHTDLLKLPEDMRTALYASGVVPVVDQFDELWGHEEDILLLAGSYGSGKSFFAVDDLIAKCVEWPYFRCYYGRKVFDTVRGSIFATIVEQIEFHGIAHEFNYSKADNSSMIITHKPSGNKFVPFGADKIDKLKSVKEPTHFLLEEIDQFTADDFGMCVSRLGRTAKAHTQLVGMCNTDRVYEEHWLYPILFDENPPIEATVHWSNYRLNTMLPSIEEYEAKLRVRAMGDEDMFNAIANGTPGVHNKKEGWLYIDLKAVFTDQPIEVIPGNTIYLSFDFNNEPMTCTAWQFSSGRHPLNGMGHFIRAVAEFEASMADTDEEIISLLCKKIRAVFPTSLFRITGDASGHARLKGVRGNKSIYFLLAKYLGVSPQLLDVPRSNLPHTTSRALCNTLLYHHRGVLISTHNTPKLASDMRRAKASPDKPDEIVKDRGANKMDYFDTFRYVFSTYFAYILK